MGDAPWGFQVLHLEGIWVEATAKCRLQNAKLKREGGH
jgi:hypothetical protein